MYANSNKNLSIKTKLYLISLINNTPSIKYRLSNISSIKNVFKINIHNAVLLENIIFKLSINTDEYTDNIKLLNQYNVIGENFKDYNKQIYFITYPMNINNEELSDPKNWELYRGDIDTW